MNYLLFDGNSRQSFLPLTYTKPIAELRIGILTVKEKWDLYLKTVCSYDTVSYLQEKYSKVLGDKNIFINACILPNQQLAESIHSLSAGQALYYKNLLVAYCCNKQEESVEISEYQHISYIHQLSHLSKVTDFFLLNSQEIEADFELMTKGRTSEPIPKGVQTINEEQIFIEEGVKVLFSSLNASEGAIYIGSNATIMEGCHVRGPFSLGSNSTLKMGAKIYGGTTIGPHSKIGGEVSDSIVMGYSNKGHDGYLGNAVVGEWCNFGAGSTNSNLKNNYSNVKLWNYQLNDYKDTQLKFCGLIMGDYSKLGINTSINTGTVIGACVSYAGGGVPKKFLPSFSWANGSSNAVYDFKKAMGTAKIVMGRRNIPFKIEDFAILKKVFEQTAKYREENL
jgi:UDP-N-acetylglucosamine diphosphorylase/glucosamine-1-phosphate N-acetyltransferase